MKEFIIGFFTCWIILGVFEMLSALEGAGVDNWEGYGYVIDMLNKDDEGEE